MLAPPAPPKPKPKAPPRPEPKPDPPQPGPKSFDLIDLESAWAHRSEESRTAFVAQLRATGYVP